MFPEPKTGNNGPELQKRRVRRIFIETAVGQRLLLLLSKKLVQNRVSWLWERKGKISRSQNVCACPFMDRYWQVGLASIKPWLLTLVCLELRAITPVWGYGSSQLQAPWPTAGHSSGQSYFPLYRVWNRLLTLLLLQPCNCQDVFSTDIWKSYDTTNVILSNICRILSIGTSVYAWRVSGNSSFSLLSYSVASAYYVLFCERW